MKNRKRFCSQRQFDQLKAIRAKELAQRLRQQGGNVTTGEKLPSSAPRPTTK